MNSLSAQEGQRGTMMCVPSYQPVAPDGPIILGPYFIVLFPSAQEGQRNFDVSLSYQPMTPEGPITPWSIFYIPEHTLRTILKGMVSANTYFPYHPIRNAVVV